GPPPTTVTPPAGAPLLVLDGTAPAPSHVVPPRSGSAGAVGHHEPGAVPPRRVGPGSTQNAIRPLARLSWARWPHLRANADRVRFRRWGIRLKTSPRSLAGRTSRYPTAEPLSSVSARSSWKIFSSMIKSRHLVTDGLPVLNSSANPRAMLS